MRPALEHNGGMLRQAPIPPDLQTWLEAAVVIDCPASLPQTQFPAMLASMWVLRLSGEVSCEGRPVPAEAWISACRVARTYRHHGAVHAVGLVLRPEAAVSLFPAARGQVDVMAPLTQIDGRHWAAAAQRLRRAASDDINLALLFDEFRRSVSRSDQALDHRQQALALMARACAAPASQDEAPALGRRQFERQFSALFGMSPKQFQLIARHNSTLRQALAWPEQGGAELALAGGYCDQSHMGRDMRRFAGHPLEALREAERPGAEEHWPLEVAAQGDPLQRPAERCKR